MYEQGDSAYLQVLLESQNYADMVNKADYIESLYEYDKQLLAGYVESKNQVAELKGRLEHEEADLEASNYELQQEEAVLQTLVDEQKKTVADFDAQLASAKKKAASYKQQLEDQTAQIKKLEDDGIIKADAVEYAHPTDKKQVGIEIHSGKNRIVRRIFESLGYHVTKLDRVYFAGLTKKNVRRGDWRYLTEKEVQMLRMGAFE